MPIFLISFIVFFSCSSFALPIEELTAKFINDGGGIEYQKKDIGMHQIILSAPKRINNELYVEKDKRINGEMSISLLRLSTVTPLSDTFKFIEQYIQDNGRSEYRCKHRGCGVSSYWANDFFDEKRLSGRDSDQYYIAGSIKHAGTEYWLTVYLVSNALRQHLAYISYIKKPLEAVGWTNGYPLLLNQELSDEVRLILSGLLATQPDLNLFVAAYVDGKKIKNISAMDKIANAPFQVIQSRLSKSLSIAPERVHLQNVGVFHTQTPVDESEVWFRLFLYSF